MFGDAARTKHVLQTLNPARFVDALGDASGDTLSVYMQNDHEQQNLNRRASSCTTWSSIAIDCNIAIGCFLFTIWPEAKGMAELIMPSPQKKWPVPPRVPFAPTQRKTEQLPRCLLKGS